MSIKQIIATTLPTLFSSVHHLEREQTGDRSLTKVGTEEPSSFDDIATTHGKKMFRCMGYTMCPRGRKYGDGVGCDPPPPKGTGQSGLKIRTTGLKIQNYAIEGLNALLSEDRQVISRPTAFIAINYKK